MQTVWLRQVPRKPQSLVFDRSSLARAYAGSCHWNYGAMCACERAGTLEAQARPQAHVHVTPWLRMLSSPPAPPLSLMARRQHGHANYTRRTNICTYIFYTWLVVANTFMLRIKFFLPILGKPFLAQGLHSTHWVHPLSGPYNCLKVDGTIFSFGFHHPLQPTCKEKMLSSFALVPFETKGCGDRLSKGVSQPVRLFGEASRIPS